MRSKTGLSKSPAKPKYKLDQNSIDPSTLQLANDFKMVDTSDRSKPKSLLGSFPVNEISSENVFGMDTTDPFALAPNNSILVPTTIKNLEDDRGIPTQYLGAGGANKCSYHSLMTPPKGKECNEKRIPLIFAKTLPELKCVDLENKSEPYTPKTYPRLSLLRGDLCALEPAETYKFYFSKYRFLVLRRNQKVEDKPFCLGCGRPLDFIHSDEIACPRCKFKFMNFFSQKISADMPPMPVEFLDAFYWQIYYVWAELDEVLPSIAAICSQILKDFGRKARKQIGISKLRTLVRINTTFGDLELKLLDLILGTYQVWPTSLQFICDLDHALQLNQCDGDLIRYNRLYVWLYMGELMKGIQKDFDWPAMPVGEGKNAR